MTPEEQDPKMHPQTARGARLAIARREIGQGSYRAVLAGEPSLSDAKRLGRGHDAVAKSAVLKAVRADEVSELSPKLRAYAKERG